MTFIYISVVVVCIGIIFLGVFIASLNNDNLKIDEDKTKKMQPIKAKRLLTNHEAIMFVELKKALPDHYIFVQVSFSALITSKGYPTRAKFNRKIADYVVTDNKLNILSVIELDDSSHFGKEDKDAERDLMLQEAGYKVLRYPNIPTVDKIQKDVHNFTK